MRPDAIASMPIVEERANVIHPQRWLFQRREVSTMRIELEVDEVITDLGRPASRGRIRQKRVPATIVLRWEARTTSGDQDPAIRSHEFRLQRAVDVPILVIEARRRGS